MDWCSWNFYVSKYLIRLTVVNVFINFKIWLINLEGQKINLKYTKLRKIRLDKLNNRWIII